LSRLQEGEDAPDGRRARLSPSPQIEYKARIANRVSAEPGWRSLTPIQELLDFT
jgi:hypothetical protein